MSISVLNAFCTPINGLNILPYAFIKMHYQFASSIDGTGCLLNTTGTQVFSFKVKMLQFTLILNFRNQFCILARLYCKIADALFQPSGLSKVAVDFFHLLNIVVLIHYFVELQIVRTGLMCRSLLC